MASERELTNRIRCDITRLVQAVADAEFWRNCLLRDAEQQHRERVATADAVHAQVVDAASSAYTAAIEGIPKEADALTRRAGLLAAPWGDPSWRFWAPAEGQTVPPFVRVGQLIETGPWDQLTMPALVPLIGGRNLVIRASGAGKEQARAAMGSIVLRLLATMPPGKLRLVCIDPVGLGSTVAGFIKGLPDFLTGGQASFDPSDIDHKLNDLEKRIASIKQKYLGVSFPTMEAFNAQAGQIEEPYRLLVVADFPARFSDLAAERLVSIATKGAEAGVYVLAMVAIDQPKFPYGFNLANLERTATVLVWQDGKFAWDDTHSSGEFKGCQVELDGTPPAAEFERIVGVVGAKAIDASEVKVPFASLGRNRPEWDAAEARTGAGLRVAIGRFGAQETQYFVLDDKMLNSALIIGRPGSGKSTLLHVLINELALAYAPDEIEMYLLDLKEVEFKDYASHRLPHARVVAIQCEREFGLSVLRGLDAQLRARMDLFRGAGVAGLNAYRAETSRKMPRVMLLVDEFQELFSTDDSLASEAGLILDRLVRQGRAFGINVVLASQTLAGPYSFSNATKNQIPIRIVLQCSDADSRLALSDENDQARLLERPGEAIYNASNGRIEGNNRFQVAWLPDSERDEYLVQIRTQVEKSGFQPAQPQVIFEGNAMAQVENNRELMGLLEGRTWPAPQRAVPAWLGDPIEIRPHTAALFRHQSRANLLIIGQNDYEQAAASMLSSAVLSLAAAHRPEAARFVVVNLAEVDAPWCDLLSALCDALPHKMSVIGRNREVVQAVEEVAVEVRSRLGQGEDGQWPSLYFVIFGLHRARDLRGEEGSYLGGAWGNRDATEHKPTPAEQLALICREGPEVGVHVLAWGDRCESLERVLDRSGLGEFDLRVVLQTSPEESRRLLDSEAAGRLGPYRAIFFDEERTGKLEKFRPYGLPSTEQIARWGATMRARN